jgi:hypothetical protein
MDFGAIALILASTDELVRALCEDDIVKQFLQDISVVDAYMWKVTAFSGWHLKGNVDTFHAHLVKLISTYVGIIRERIRVDVARASSTLLRHDESTLLLPELLRRRDWIEHNLNGVFVSSEIIEELMNINTDYHWDIIDRDWSKKTQDDMHMHANDSDDTIADMHVRRAVWVWRRHPEMSLPGFNSLLFSSYMF